MAAAAYQCGVPGAHLEEHSKAGVLPAPVIVVVRPPQAHQVAPRVYPEVEAGRGV